MNFNDLGEQEWLKRNYESEGKTLTLYMSPLEDGMRRKIKSSNDLRENEKHLSSILFPHSTSTTKRGQDGDVSIQGKIAHQLRNKPL